MKPFARTQSIVVVSFLMAALSMGAFGFLVERIVSLNRSSTELAAALTTDGAREERLRTFARLEGQLQAEEAALDARFIGADGIVPFIELLESAGADAGVSVDIASVDIDPELSEGEHPHEWLRIALRSEGSWEDLFHFVMLLETVPYAVRIDQALLQAGGEENPDPSAPWVGTFVIRAAVLKG